MRHEQVGNVAGSSEGPCWVWSRAAPAGPDPGAWVAVVRVQAERPGRAPEAAVALRVSGVQPVALEVRAAAAVRPAPRVPAESAGLQEPGAASSPSPSSWTTASMR